MPDPFRPKPGLIVHSTHPYNAEPPLDRLRARLLTAQADFYVRSHGDIPGLDGARHRLRVDGLVSAPLDLSMAELRGRFAQHKYFLLCIAHAHDTAVVLDAHQHLPAPRVSQRG